MKNNPLPYTEEDLISYFKQPPVSSNGISLRFANCPFCGAVNESNPAFAVDLNKQSCFCHCCEDGGSLKTLIGSTQLSIEVLREAPIAKVNSGTNKKTASELFNGIYTVAAKGSLTDLYLNSRKIHRKTFGDLDFPLRESKNPYNGQRSVAIYPLINEKNEIVAIQRVILDEKTKTKTRKLYHGPKSLGVAVLKRAPKMIIAEGLETGLSVRAHLGNSYGLIICGDAGNLEKLATEHSWAIQNCAEIIIAADNDMNGIGTAAAREVLFKFPHKTILKAPSLPGKDWNDMLVEGLISKEWL